MGRDPIPRRRSFPGAPMRGPRSTRYQPRFPAVVPVRGEGRSRVTHPFATSYPAEAGFIVRLACVRHAASVHPEPGSNSSFGRPEGRLKFKISEKAIGMMVRNPGSGSFMELVSRSEISAGTMPAGAPHAFLSVSSVSGFQGPGGLSAPAGRFLPSAAQGDILRAPPPRVKGESHLFPGKGRLGWQLSPCDLGLRASIALRAVHTTPT